MTYAERAKLFEELRELSKTLKVPVIVAKQAERPVWGMPPEWRQRPDIVIFDYPGILPLWRS